LRKDYRFRSIVSFIRGLLGLWSGGSGIIIVIIII
jgi:hypothetical protein